MAQNNTSSNASAPGSSDGFQCFRPVESFTVTMNVISLLINSFHLCIISRLETLKGTKYRCVLINIVLADITNTMAMALFYSCYDFVLANYMHGEPEVRIPVSVSIFISNYISFHVFLVASMEKYLAICKPFSYQSSVLVRWLPLNFVIIWLYIFSLSTILSLINALNLIPGISNLGITVFRTAVFAVAPNVVSGTLLIKVYKEMRRMRNRSEISAQDSEKTNAATYLIIIFTLEMIAFLLNSVCIVFTHSTGNPLLCTIWNAFIKAPYTMLNTVIYGWRTQSYRQHVCKLFGCNRRRISIAEG